MEDCARDLVRFIGALRTGFETPARLNQSAPDRAISIGVVDLRPVLGSMLY